MLSLVKSSLKIKISNPQKQLNCYRFMLWALWGTYLIDAGNKFFSSQTGRLCQNHGLHFCRSSTTWITPRSLSLSTYISITRQFFLNNIGSRNNGRFLNCTRCISCIKLTLFVRINLQTTEAIRLHWVDHWWEIHTLVCSETLCMAECRVKESTLQ